MAKIKLCHQPKTVSLRLTVPMLDGTDGEISIDYIYRPRKAFAAFVDGRIAVIKAAAEAALAAEQKKIEAEKNATAEAAPINAIQLPLSEVELESKKIESQVEFIMGAVEGWNLDIPFDREAVEELANTLPLVATTIIHSYRTAMTEGRLGN